MSGGTKYDQDKPGVHLLDPIALEGIARVLDFGAKKYAAHNWRKGISYTRLLGALLRHCFAILRGEDVDPESGLPHIDHLGCCWMFLSNQMKTRPDLDDRYKEPKKETTPNVCNEYYLTGSCTDCKQSDTGPVPTTCWNLPATKRTT